MWLTELDQDMAAVPVSTLGICMHRELLMLLANIRIYSQTAFLSALTCMRCTSGMHDHDELCRLQGSFARASFPQPSSPSLYKPSLSGSSLSCSFSNKMGPTVPGTRREAMWAVTWVQSHAICAGLSGTHFLRLTACVFPALVSSESCGSEQDKTAYASDGGADGRCEAMKVCSLF